MTSTTNKDIVRYYRDSGKKRLIHANVTLEQAQAWCSSEFTHKADKWFDGFITAGGFPKSTRAMYQHFFLPTEQE